jgi:DeoR family ulaG and ulaABCDEF operon transcriptional repressor
MEIQDRHKRLLKLLAAHGTASVSQLADWLGVSPATVRRDLSLLDTAGQIRRVRGGGAHVDGGRAAALRSGSFASATQRHPGRKRAIARYAAGMCADGDTILIGGGTTTCAMADFLDQRRMRVLTNSFEVARILLAGSENEVILSGGKIYAEQSIVLSPFDTEAIQYCYADKLFLGVHGLAPLGLMEADPLLIQAGRRLIGQAQQVVVLADSSKFGNKGGMFLCSLDQVSCVVTDDGVADGTVQMLERAGVEVRVVTADPLRDDVADADGIVAAQRYGPPAQPPKMRH